MISLHFKKVVLAQRGDGVPNPVPSAGGAHSESAWGTPPPILTHHCMEQAIQLRPLPTSGLSLHLVCLFSANLCAK